MYWQCIVNVLTMYWQCIGNALVMHWQCLSYVEIVASIHQIDHLRIQDNAQVFWQGHHTHLTFSLLITPEVTQTPIHLI